MPASVVARNCLIFVHRWMGVALSVLFLVWFVSGVVLMYWDFPSVGAEDRLTHAGALDVSRVRLSAAEALAVSSPPPTQIRLNTFDGRPAYRFRTGPRGRETAR